MGRKSGSGRRSRHKYREKHYARIRSRADELAAKYRRKGRKVKIGRKTRKGWPIYIY